ncbi:MAG TPA: serpin family protein [Blastocatellia bacterium]|nr:serpin family protein [Blastocatellia bacterium]
MATSDCRKTVLVILVLIALILPALIGCTSASVSSQPADNREARMEEQPQPISTGNVDPRLIAANTRFGFKLYAELLKEKPGQNALVSPSSVALALAMTYNGAEGGTREAMARALELQGLTLADVNRANADLKASLENPDPKVQLQIANSLWSKRGFTFKPDFIKRNTEYYKAEVSELDFNDPAAAARINRWVSDKTNAKIPKIIDQISPDSILFLINAIYFKGKWANEFDKSATHDEPFYLANGREKKHPMMRRSGEYRYYEEKGFQAVNLPYGSGRLSMYVFLPAKDSSLDGFHRNLTAANWETWMTRFEKSDGEILLPRFTIEFEAELNGALKALGMGVAFDPAGANFKNMIQMSENAYINKVKHKTFAEVNEEGTEAAAVTSVDIVATSVMRPKRTFKMVVDRPFFCAIRDNQTGSVLFMGSILDPR